MATSPENPFPRSTVESPASTILADDSNSPVATVESSTVSPFDVVLSESNEGFSWGHPYRRDPTELPVSRELRLELDTLPPWKVDADYQAELESQTESVSGTGGQRVKQPTWVAEDLAALVSIPVFIISLSIGWDRWPFSTPMESAKMPYSVVLMLLATVSAVSIAVNASRAPASRRHQRFIHYSIRCAIALVLFVVCRVALNWFQEIAVVGSYFCIVIFYAYLSAACILRADDPRHWIVPLTGILPRQKSTIQSLANELRKKSRNSFIIRRLLQGALVLCSGIALLLAVTQP